MTSSAPHVQRKADAPRGRQRSQREFEALLDAANLAPETKLAALLLFDSLAACRTGDAMACQWLQQCAPTYIEVIAKGDDGERWIEKLTPMIAGTQCKLFELS